MDNEARLIYVQGVVTEIVRRSQYRRSIAVTLSGCCKYRGKRYFWHRRVRISLYKRKTP